MRKKNSSPVKISKEELIYDTLRGMCMRLGPNSQLPTVSQLCETIGASRSTLDRVLRRLEEDHILVCRHGSGIYVSPQLTRKTVGLVFGHNIYGQNHSPFWHMMLDAARQLAEKRQHELRVYFDCPSSTEESPRSYHISKDAGAGRLDGFLALCPATQREWMMQWNRPVVALTDKGPRTGTVIVDPALQIHLAVKALREAGCKRVAFVSVAPSPEDPQGVSDVRTQMFRREVQAQNLVLSEELVWLLPWWKPEYRGHTFEEFGFDAAKERFPAYRKGTRPQADGIIVSDDMMARGVIAWLHKAGWPVGDAVHLAAFTNAGSPALKFFHDEIFRVESDPLLIMEAMFDLLEGSMAGRNAGQDFVMVKPELIRPVAGGR